MSNHQKTIPSALSGVAELRGGFKAMPVTRLAMFREQLSRIQAALLDFHGPVADSLLAEMISPESSLFVRAAEEGLSRDELLKKFIAVAQTRIARELQMIQSNPIRTPR